MHTRMTVCSCGSFMNLMYSLSHSFILFSSWMLSFRIPLRQCQQKYLDMDKELRETLRGQIDSVAPEYGFSEISFPSFLRHYTFTLKYSASDIVYCMNALLGAPPEIATKLGTEIPWNEDKENEMDDVGVRNVWKRNFYTTYDALGL